MKEYNLVWQICGRCILEKIIQHGNWKVEERV
jgi:hypothetical protein